MMVVDKRGGVANSEVAAGLNARSKCGVQSCGRVVGNGVNDIIIIHTTNGPDTNHAFGFCGILWHS